MKIAVLIIKGIGDTLHALPALKRLRQAKPDAAITVVVADDSCSQIINASGLSMCPVILPFRRKGTLIRCLGVLHRLRRESFDVSITMFPSNRVWYNLFARIMNARLRITHRYPCGRLRTLAFLQNTRIDAPRNLHTVEHNLNLLSALDIDSTFTPLWEKGAGGQSKRLLVIPDDAIAQAEAFISASFPALTKKPVALHASISDTMVYKRWDHSNIAVFARIADRIHNEYERPVVLIAGPDEKHTAAAIAAVCAIPPAICDNLPILATAALLERCALLINTDSGIGHLAASQNVPVITIFGAANFRMTRPFSEQSFVVRRDIPCSPCYDYPYDSCKPHINCDNGACFGTINIDDVMSAAHTYLKDTALP